MTRAPSVFTIDPSHSFADELVKGLSARFGDDPLQFSSVMVMVPNRRAVRSVRDAFLRLHGDQPMLLPDLRAVGDIDEGEIETISAGMGLDFSQIMPPIPVLRRQALLVQLVERWQQPATGQQTLAPAQAWRLASELATFLDHVHTADVSFDRLADLVPENLASHWVDTLDFLRILTLHWPAILQELQMQDPAAHRNQAIRALASYFEERVPTFPIVLAGSTGSIPATASLMKVVARLPAGHIVLPGLANELNDDVWNAVDETHPQHALKHILEHIKVSRFEVENWHTQAVSGGRKSLLHAAMLPAAQTSEWRGLQLSQGDLDQAFDGFTALVAQSRREEATAIAVVLREALEEPGKTAALVTPDRQLALHVRSALRKWLIDIDDSGGDKALASLPGRLLSLLAAAVSDHFGPLSLLALLQHPLTAFGKSRGDFLTFVRRLDSLVLRGVRPAGGLQGIQSRGAALTVDKKNDWGPPDQTMLEEIIGVFLPLEQAFKEPAAFETLLPLHIEVVETLCTEESKSGADKLWAGEAGAALASEFASLLEHAAELQVPSADGYESLFAEVFSTVTVRPAWNKHPRLSILGPLEARLQQADLMVIGGLNEGVWPADITTDPWMNRSMRAEFGLPPLEGKIGQSAHDFVMAVSAPKVLVTRAEKIDGAPTVPSRWWFRIEAFAGREIPRADHYLAWARELDKPDQITPVLPPAPRPPVSSRPTRLSVTQVQEWMRDPYALFAKKILGLKVLDPIDDRPNAAQKGIILHEALERFLTEDGEVAGPEGLIRLMSIGREVFEPVVSQPAVYAFWWPRFEKIAHWFVDSHPVHSERYETVLVEGWAEKAIETVGDPPVFTLVAKADRIDRNRSNGSLMVIDYKTGTVPTTRQMEAGFAPQLPLEAWLAEVGAFDGLVKAPVEDLVFWKLSGGTPVQEQKRPLKDVSGVADEAVEGLAALVKAFADQNTAYLSNPRPSVAGYGDFDHLARVKEWRDQAPSESSQGEGL